MISNWKYIFHAFALIMSLNSATMSADNQQPILKKNQGKLPSVVIDGKPFKCEFENTTNKTTVCIRYKGKAYFEEHPLLEQSNHIIVDNSEKKQFQRANDCTEYFKYIRQHNFNAESFSDIHNRGSHELQEIWGIIGQIPSLETKNIAIAYVNGEKIDYVFISAPCTIDEIAVIKGVPHGNIQKGNIERTYRFLDIDSIGSSHHVLDLQKIGYLNYLIEHYPDFFQPFERKVFQQRNQSKKDRSNFYGNFGHAEQAIISYIFSIFSEKLDTGITLDIISMYDPCPVCLRTLFLLSNKNLLINVSSIEAHDPSKSRQGARQGYEASPQFSPYFHIKSIS